MTNRSATNRHDHDRRGAHDHTPCLTRFLRLDGLEALPGLLGAQRLGNPLRRRSYGQDVPRPGYAFEFVRAPGLESDVGAHDQVANGRRTQDLRGASKRHHSGRGVHRDPTRSTLDGSGFSRVETASDVQTDGLDVVRDLGRTTNGPRRLGERREEPVSRGVLLVAVVRLEISANESAELPEGGTPMLVADVGSDLCGSDDVQEQHRRYARWAPARSHTGSIGGGSTPRNLGRIRRDRGSAHTPGRDSRLAVLT
jgi:hypothetical protein